MRIGFDARWYNQTGVGNYVRELLRAIGSLRENVEIIAYENATNPLKDIASQHVCQITIHAKRYSLEEQVELAYRCRVDRIDVFHSPFYITPWLASCPVVVTIHDLIPFLFATYSTPKRALVRLGYRAAAKKATRVIAVSKNTAIDISRILKIPEERINIVHLGVSALFRRNAELGEGDRLATKFGIHKPYVLTLSAKNWRTKNLSNVLKALLICKRELKSDFQIVVVGSREGLQEACKTDAIKMKGIVSTGFVSNSDLAMLYRGAEVFVMCSKYEGFGLPLLEAMSSGCAVVSSNTGSLPEVAGAGATVVDPDDTQQLATAVTGLLRDPEERRRQQARSLTRGMEFSWESAARQTLSVYSQALARHI